MLPITSTRRRRRRAIVISEGLNLDDTAIHVAFLSGLVFADEVASTCLDLHKTPRKRSSSSMADRDLVVQDL